MATSKTSVGYCSFFFIIIIISVSCHDRVISASTVNCGASGEEIVMGVF